VKTERDTTIAAAAAGINKQSNNQLFQELTAVQQRGNSSDSGDSDRGGRRQRL